MDVTLFCCFSDRSMFSVDYSRRFNSIVGVIFNGVHTISIYEQSKNRNGIKLMNYDINKH